MKSVLPACRSWYLTKSDQHPCVIAVKWVAFRNLEGWPFPSRCDAAIQRDLVSRVALAFSNDFGEPSERIDWETSTPLVKGLAQERLLLSEASTRPGSGVSWFWNDEERGLHFGGEDHLRLTFLRAGGDVSVSFTTFSEWLEEMAFRLGFAFRSGWGWVTADPSFAGSAVQPAALLHLPASAASGLWEAMMKTVERRGFSLVPVWAGPRGESDFFWLKGDFSFGRTAEELERTLADLVDKITKGETEARRREMETHRLDVEDRVGRAWGLLTNARRLSWEEALPALSALRRAPELVIIKTGGMELLDRLFFRLQGAQLRSSFSEREGAEDLQRAVVAQRMLLEGEDACLKD